MAFVTKVEAGSTTGPVGSSLFGTCETSAGVAVKEATVPGLDALVDGLTIHVRFKEPNAAAGAVLVIRTVDNVERRIYRHGVVIPWANTTDSGKQSRASWYPGSVVSLTYDAENDSWNMNDWQSDTTYENATTSAAGLMSREDKVALDNIRTKRTTSLVFHNLPTTTWTEENPKTYASYPYKATIACPGVTAAHFAQVCFNPEDVVSYVPAPVCQTGADVVTVWMMIKPDNALTVPTIFAILPDRT